MMTDWRGRICVEEREWGEGGKGREGEGEEREGEREGRRESREKAILFGGDRVLSE